MPVIGSRLFLIGVCASLIAGCGGGGSTTGGGGGNGGGGNDSTTVTITFGGPLVPVAVAAKIGTGSFAAQTLSGSTLSLSIPSGTSNYAVAYLCPAEVTGVSSSSQFEYAWEVNIADGTSPSFACAVDSVGDSQTGNLTGSVDASALPDLVTTFDVYSDNNGYATESGQGGPTGSFNNLYAVNGNDRILILAMTNQGLLEAAKSFANQAVPGALNGGNTVAFTTADEIVPETIAYNNVPSGFSNPNTYAALEMGGVAYSPLVPLNMQATTQYPALPAGATENGDVYFFRASSYASGSNPAAVSSGVTNSGGPVSLTFPAPWSYAGPTAAALPSFTFVYTGFTGETIVTQEAGLEWSVGSGSSTLKQIFVEATANYQGGSTSLEVPDLSGVAGFLANPASGTQVAWQAQITQQSYSPTSPTPPNATWSDVENSGFFTVP